METCSFEAEKRPVILVTNDDGVAARGIRCLVAALCGLGRIVVVAPDAPRSGHSCSFTATGPVVLRRVSDDGDVAVFSLSGTPVDCVKLAMHRFFARRRPDLVVSGINHGANSSVCVVYSGTMGAVIEGCIVGVPSIGFSLCDHREEADFGEAARIARRVTETVLRRGMARGTCLNVNIPAVAAVRGIRVCRQSDGCWIKEFVLLNEDDDGATYRVTGEYRNREPAATDTDEHFLARGYATIVPTRFDLTAYGQLADAKHLEV